jgi:predicted DsbA family dithiol-disulfide isomerase
LSARVRLFIDPGCPVAFADEPRRRRLEWEYGIEWDLHVCVTRSRREDEWTDGERFARLAGTSGMPIDARDRVWGQATIHACRAVVAARLRWPDRAEALLRRLQVLIMAGELADDSDTLELAAAQAGLPVAEIAAYCAEDEVEEALRADMAAAPACPALDASALAGLEPRPDPETAIEVLEWARFPLATAEVAAVCGRDVGDELERVARFDAGYWTV